MVNSVVVRSFGNVKDRFLFPKGERDVTQDGETWVAVNEYKILQIINSNRRDQLKRLSKKKSVKL